jgi:tRNA pseudouridine38-40 synthase
MRPNADLCLGGMVRSVLRDDHGYGRGQHATIQEILALAIKDVVKHPINLVGSSRTDARVHAKGQVAHFDTHMTQIPIMGLQRAINSRLPDDIDVVKIEPVPDTFDAIS